MKTITQAILLLTISLIPPVYSQARAPIKVNVPFDFVVGDTHLQAGSYTLERTDQDLPITLIRSEDGHQAVFALTSPLRIAFGEPKVVFNRYGDRYFLSEIRAGTLAGEVPKSRIEREAMVDSAPESVSLPITK